VVRKAIAIGEWEGMEKRNREQEEEGRGDITISIHGQFGKILR